MPPGAAAMATVPETPPPSGHDAMQPTACEVASGLESTRRGRDKVSAPLPPVENVPQPPAAQPPAAPAGQAGDPLPPLSDHDVT